MGVQSRRFGTHYAEVSYIHVLQLPAYTYLNTCTYMYTTYSVLRKLVREV